MKHLLFYINREKNERGGGVKKLILLVKFNMFDSKVNKGGRDESI